MEKFSFQGKFFLPWFTEPFTKTPDLMNQHSPDKEPLSLQIPRTLKVRLYRIAQKMGLKVSELVVRILLAETANTPISSSDYEAIAAATRKAEQTGKRLATVLDDSTGPKG